MKLTIAEQIMFSVLQINMLDADSNLIGTATGFIFQFCFDEKTKNYYPALVTNRHVASECDKISVLFTAADENGSPVTGKTIPVVFQNKNAIVFHPNPDIDLAAILIGQEINTLQKSGTKLCFCALPRFLIPDKDTWDSFDAVEQVLMVGYPKGLRDNANNLPIFRRGITATHPKYDFNGTPELLVDMPCYEGCSGSPVFIYNDGTLFDHHTHNVSFGSQAFLLGVQHATIKSTTIGEIQMLPISNQPLVPKPVFEAYLNLGYVTKSTELLAIDSIINHKFGS